jgi:hypothetical protein
LTQDIVRVAAWGAGVGIIEASAVAIADAALVLAGPSEAGKTTLLASLLTHGGCEFMANDEVMMELVGHQMMAMGSPVHVMIRPSLAMRYPQLDDVGQRLAQSGEEKCSMHFREFAARFRAQIKTEAVVGVLAVLGHGDQIRKLEAADAIDLLDTTILWDNWDTPWRDLLEGSFVGKASASKPSATPRARTPRETFLDSLTSLGAVFHIGRDAPLENIRELTTNTRASGGAS